MQRIAGLAACALASGGLWLAAAAAAEQTVAEPDDAKSAFATDADATGEPAAPPGKAEGERAASRSWWHEPDIVETLSLSEEQRSAMDGFLEEYRQRIREHHRRAPDSFFDALRGGRWNDARRELAALAEQASAPLRASGELKIDVLSTLTDEQLELVRDRYPRLIQRPWVRMRRPGGGGPGRPKAPRR